MSYRTGNNNDFEIQGEASTITQFSTIDALLAGLYDGRITFADLLSHGDFGVGTLDKLDGEIIVLNRQIYQVKANGKVYKPSLKMTTPFATLINFQPRIRLRLKAGTGLENLQEIVNKMVPNQNIFCAVKVTGRFVTMKARSLMAQKKPYQPMVKIHQWIFPLKDITGTIVGFRSPEYLKDVTVPGFHLHFLSEDCQHGGHILEFTLAKGMAEIDLCYRFLLILPQHYAEFGRLDLKVDRLQELEQVEK